MNLLRLDVEVDEPLTKALTCQSIDVPGGLSPARLLLVLLRHRGCLLDLMLILLVLLLVLLVAPPVVPLADVFVLHGRKPAAPKHMGLEGSRKPAAPKQPGLEGSRKPAVPKQPGLEGSRKPAAPTHLDRAASLLA